MFSNYDIKNENVYYYIHEKCISNQPINFYGKNIKQILLKDYFNNGEEWFSKLISPFVFDKDIFINEKLNIDELLFYFILSQEELKDKKEDILFNQIIDSIKWFFDTDNISIKVLNDSNGDIIDIGICVDNNLIIDSPKYNELKNIILILSGELNVIHKKDLKENCIKDIKDEKFRKRFEKYQKYQKAYEEREAKKNNKVKKIFNKFRTVVYSQENFDFEKVLNWNLYQLNDAYFSIYKKEEHDTNLRLYTSGNLTKEDIESLDLKPFHMKILK